MKGSDIIHQVGTMDVNLAATPMKPDKAGDLRKSIIAKIVILVLLLVLLLVLILPKNKDESATKDAGYRYTPTEEAVITESSQVSQLLF